MYIDKSKKIVIKIGSSILIDKKGKPKKKWLKVNKKPNIVIFEGWCVGVTPQKKRDLKTPINQLEKEHDTKKIWREKVNLELKDKYQKIFSLIDKLIFSLFFKVIFKSVLDLVPPPKISSTFFSFKPPTVADFILEFKFNFFSKSSLNDLLLLIFLVI